MTPHVLTLNAGSSSIKFSLVAVENGALAPRAVGEIEGLGGKARLRSRKTDEAKAEIHELAAEAARDHDAALATSLDWLRREYPDASIRAVGHRIVHGGPDFDRPALIDDAVLARLTALESWAPLHQPHNLAGVRAARAAFPGAPQIACFDTAFHRGHAFAADAYALPRALYDEGVRRYGFHGLSYEYVSESLARIAPDIAGGRVIVAHLGNGASMCGLKAGKSVASTMGFSTLDGLPMGTRPGQLDPGVMLYLMRAKGYDAQALTELLYKQSGLKGLSGLSNDMRELEASQDARAREAIDCFVFRLRHEIGALAAALGGLDALVFCGGIGENSARIRAETARGMEWLGLAIDDERNRENATFISPAGSSVRALVVRTNEEIKIAEHTARLGLGAVAGN